MRHSTQVNCLKHLLQITLIITHFLLAFLTKTLLCLIRWKLFQMIYIRNLRKRTFSKVLFSIIEIMFYLITLIFSWQCYYHASSTRYVARARTTISSSYSIIWNVQRRTFGLFSFCMCVHSFIGKISNCFQYFYICSNVL